MEKKNEILYQGMLIILMGTICNLALGVLLFGWHVQEYAFQVQFLVVGLVGSCFFAALKFSQLKDAILLLLLLYILYVTLFNINSLDFLLGHACFFAGVGVALYLFHIFFYTKLQKLKVGKFLVLALMIAVMYALATAIVGIFLALPDFGEEIMKNFTIGFIVGSGLGIGFELSEMIYHPQSKIFAHR
jgi:hypothetical protein